MTAVVDSLEPETIFAQINTSKEKLSDMDELYESMSILNSFTEETEQCEVLAIPVNEFKGKNVAASKRIKKNLNLKNSK